MYKVKKVAWIFCFFICFSLCLTACSNKGGQAGSKFQTGLSQAQWKAFNKTDSLLNAKLTAQAEAKAKEKQGADGKTSSAGDQADEDFSEKKFTTLYDVNLRSGPGTNYDVVDLLAANTPLVQTGPEEDGWLPVATDEIRGYIRQDLLTPATEMPVSAR